MSLRSRINGWLQQGDAKVIEAPLGEEVKEFTEIDFFKTNPKGAEIYSADSEAYTRLYGIIASVYKSVSVIAQNIAQLNLKVLDVTNPEDPKDLTQTDEFKLFQKYNDQMTSYEFWEAVITFMELTGEAPLLKKYEGGKVVELYPFSNEYLIVIPENEFQVNSYVISVMGSRIHAEPTDILMLKHFDPAEPLRGIAPLKAAIRDITLDLNMVNSSRVFFENGARPSGILSSKQEMGTETFKRAVTLIKKGMEGVKNSGKIGVVSHGFEFKPMNLSSKDVQLIEQREFTKDTIRSVYGVPPIYFQDYGAASVLANADVQKQMLWLATLIPRLTKIEKIFTTFLIPELTDKKNIVVKFDLSEISVLQEDIDALFERWDKGVENGSLTRNEMRQKIYHLEPSTDEGMDEHIIPNRLPAVVEPEPQKKLDDQLEKMFPTTLKDITKSIEEVQKQMTEAEIEEDKAATVDAVLKQADAIADNFEGLLLKLFKEQEAEVLAGINELKNYKDYPPMQTTAALFDYDKWVTEYTELGKPYIAEALEKGILQWGEKYGESVNIHAPGMQGYVNEASHTYATLVNKTTVSSIDSIIAAGLDAGATITKIGEDIAKYFAESESYRAQRIARTEMVRAANRGRLEANTQSSKYKYHMWLTSRDQFVRDSHSEAEGQIVRVGDAFLVNDDTQSDSRYPSGINERCTTIPTKEKS